MKEINEAIIIIQSQLKYLGVEVVDFFSRISKNNEPNGIWNWTLRLIISSHYQLQPPDIEAVSHLRIDQAQCCLT